MNQNNTPLFTAVKKYKDEKPAYFCIPGHRAARGIAAEWIEDVGEQIFGYDLTEAHGLDDLHAPEGAIKEAQDLTADLYGADKSWFLVNGTTCGNEAMLLSVLRPGDKVLLLPSTSLYEQQARLRDFISQRFGSSTPFQQPQQQNVRFR